METKRMYCGGGAHASKKLLAALAVLAVALIALVAVPAVDASGDDAEVPSGTNGDTTMTADSVLSFTTDGKTTYYGANDMEALAVKIEEATGEVTIKVLKDFEFDTSIATNTGYLGTKATVTFDGDGKTLTAEGAALFSRINYGTFTFTDLTITGTVNKKYTGDNDSIGAFINQTGYDRESRIAFERCNVTGAVIYDGYYAGGFIGYPTKSSTISFYECKVDGNTKITGIKRAGGFLGLAYSDVTMEDCTIENTTVKNLFDARKVAENEKNDNKAYNKWRVGLAASIFNMKDGKVDISGFTIGPGNTLIQGVMEESEAEYISIAVPEGYKGTEFISCGKCEATLTVDNTKITAGNGNFIPYANGEISVDEEFVVPAGCELNADIVLSDGAEVVFGAGSSYTGTITHVESVNEENKSRSNTAVFDNIRFSGKSVVAAGSLELQAEIDAAAENGGTVTLTGNVVITDDVVVKSGVKIVIEGEADVTIENGASFKFETGSELEVKQNANVASEGNGKVVIESGVTATGLSSIDADVQIDDSAMETVYMSGVIAENIKGRDQRVVIDRDSAVVGLFTIKGQLEIPEGVTVTVKAGGEIVIDSIYESVINGTLIMEGSEDGKPAAALTVKNSAELKIAGTLSIEGELANQGSEPVEILQGADVTVGTDGSIAGEFKVGDSAALNINGVIASGTFLDNAGTVTVVSSAVSGASGEAIVVHLDDKAVLDIQKIVLADGACILVYDDGVEVYDRKDLIETVFEWGDEMEVGNGLIIAGTADASTTGVSDPAAAGTYQFGAAITGLKVSVAEEVTKIYAKEDDENNTYITGTTAQYGGTENGFTERASVMSVTGAVSVIGELIYDGADGRPVVTGKADITAIAFPAISISNMVVGAGIDFNAKDLAMIFEEEVSDINLEELYEVIAPSTVIDGPVTLSYAPAVGDVQGVNTTAVCDDARFGTFTNMTKLTVKADVSAAACKNLFVNEGTVTVAGGTITTVGSAIAAPLDSAVYSVTTVTPAYTTYYHMTVDAAIAAMGAGTTKDVSLYGTQTLVASAEIPKAAKLTLQSGAVLNVGADKDAVDVVLTVASEGSLKAVSGAEGIIVNGSVYAERYSDIDTAARGIIKADVFSYKAKADGSQDNRGWAMWTNLTVALGSAESGSVVRIMQPATVAASTTVKEGVTLDANGNSITVKQKAVLTIDGTLDLTNAASSLYLENAVKNASGQITAAAGAVVLNGYVQYDNDDQITRGTTVTPELSSSSPGAYTIPGAYYRMDVDGSDVECVTSYSNGAAIIATVVDQEMELRGDADNKDTVALGNISFTGAPFEDDGIETAVITVGNAAVVTGTIELKDARFVVNGCDVTPDGASGNVRGTYVDATFAGNGGKIAVKGLVRYNTEANGQFSVVAGSYGADEAEADALMVFGTVTDFAPVSGSASSNTSFEVLDDVRILGALTVRTDSFKVTGNLAVAGISDAAASLTVGNTTVSGTLLVGYEAVGPTVIVIGNLAVPGDMTVVNGSVSVQGDMTVSGTVDAAAVDEDSGLYSGSVAVVGSIYIGVTKAVYGGGSNDVAKMKIAPTASVTGKVSFGTNSEDFAAVAAGATAPAAWASEDSAYGPCDLKSTAFNYASTGADGYITVYANKSNNVYVAKFKAYIADNEVIGWYSAADKKNAAYTPAHTSEDGNKISETGTKIGDSKYAEVSMVLDGELFTVKIVPDGGIGRVTLNGKLMEHDSDGSFYARNIKAGSYTVEFAAAAGYDASKVVLTDKDGNVVNTKTIAVDDVAAGYDATVSGSQRQAIAYQLVGSEVAVSGGSSSGGMSHDDAQGIIDAIDKNTDAVKNQPAGGSADNSLTNILLIVLVVLIVIMAALVAMRMMRS